MKIFLPFGNWKKCFYSTLQIWKNWTYFFFRCMILKIFAASYHGNETKNISSSIVFSSSTFGVASVEKRNCFKRLLLPPAASTAVTKPGYWMLNMWAGASLHHYDWGTKRKVCMSHTYGNQRETKGKRKETIVREQKKRKNNGRVNTRYGTAQIPRVPRVANLCAIWSTGYSEGSWEEQKLGALLKLTNDNVRHGQYRFFIERRKRLHIGVTYA